ncbi:hypothetical protein GDO81_022722, partial [Engystomops pustulosus]
GPFPTRPQAVCPPPGFRRGLRPPPLSEGPCFFFRASLRSPLKIQNPLPPRETLSPGGSPGRAATGPHPKPCLRAPPPPLPSETPEKTADPRTDPRSRWPGGPPGIQTRRAPGRTAPGLQIGTLPPHAPLPRDPFAGPPPAEPGRLGRGNVARKKRFKKSRPAQGRSNSSAGVCGARDPASGPARPVPGVPRVPPAVFKPPSFRPELGHARNARAEGKHEKKIASRLPLLRNRSAPPRIPLSSPPPVPSFLFPGGAPGGFFPPSGEAGSTGRGKRDPCSRRGLVERGADPAPTQCAPDAPRPPRPGQDPPPRPRPPPLKTRTNGVPNAPPRVSKGPSKRNPVFGPSMEK